nr:unnamed protein product [Spirometra erinaceieuropaei]
MIRDRVVRGTRLLRAFNTVNRDGLWKIMQKFGCPQRFTNTLPQLHDGMIVRVTGNMTVSASSAVTNGVKQDCVRAPLLFGLMFSVMLIAAYSDGYLETRIAYRTDGYLRHSRSMQALTRIFTATVHELLLTGDCALNTTTDEEMHGDTALFHAGCVSFGLAIITNKPVVLRQSSPKTEYNYPRSNVKGSHL